MHEKKATGRPRKFDGTPMNCSFKLPLDKYNAFKDFSALTGESMSDLVVEFVNQLIDANAGLIAEYRRQRGKAVKPQFSPFKPKSARAFTSDEDLPRGEDDNAENG